jgi:metal-sulfur cluster biosynthetic enzyme
VDEVAVNAVGASPEREAVISALDNCFDPCCRERRISVVDMGLIESIDIQDREVKVEMVLTTGWCPFAYRLRRHLRGARHGQRRGSGSLTRSSPQGPTTP